MIQRVIVVAAVLLLVQLALLANTFFGNRGEGEYRPGEPLLQFPAEAVDRVEISDDQGGRLVLTRGPAGWRMPNHFDAPADTAQVRALLDKLAALAGGQAVAATAEAAGRFKVATDDFRRHLLLSAGENELANLYVGTSPGFRQAHARLAAEAEIVTVALTTFDLETAMEQWLDKEQLKLAEEELVAVVAADFSLRRQEEKWHLAGLAGEERQNDEAVADLLLRIGGLTPQKVLDPAMAAPLFAAPADLHYTLVFADGRRREYRFVRLPEEEAFALQLSDRDLIYQVHRLPVEGLQKLNRQGLLAASGQADPGAGPVAGTGSEEQGGLLEAVPPQPAAPVGIAGGAEK